ncbi:MAG TPA: nucleotide exchange factor GrpE, partial [Terriglobales bacterium]
MVKVNKGNGEGNPLDLEHELPQAENELAEESPQGSPAAAEIESLKAEKATYLDRLARLQAEFDNYRKRAVKEQQEFRDYALLEALKQVLPILDSLDR